MDGYASWLRRGGWCLIGMMLAMAVRAEQTPTLRHALFIAGPNFTGILAEDGLAQWSTRPGARDGYVLGNDHVLIAWSKEVVEFDTDRQPIWTYKLDASNQEIGSAQRLANGNTLISELGANPRLIEVSPEGEICVQVALKPETDHAHMQTRMARKLENGNYLVPHLLAFSVKEYTPQGNVVKTFKTYTESFGGPESKNWPFTAIRTPASKEHPKGTTVVGCTYGNRVVEFDAEGNVIWELSNKQVDGIIKDACGVQRLLNGNTVVACYGKKDGIKLFEVNSEKQVVWQYSGPYRVHHFQVLTTNGEKLTDRPMK